MTPLPIIFAPGMMCDIRLFEKQTAFFEHNHPIGIADMSKDETISAMARRLLDAAQAPFFLAGLSLGGILAFEIWRQAPESVAGLALLNTTPFADSPARRAVRLAQMDDARNGHLERIVVEELKPNYLGSVTKDDEAVLNTLYAMAADLGPEVFVQQTKAAMSRPDSVRTLDTITCPTTIIAGQEDEVCPPELHAIMHAGITGSSLNTLPRCGHLSTLEAADSVNLIMAKCISDAQPRES